MTTLQKRLEAVIGGATGIYGVAVENLETGEKAAINGDVPFQTASACKVAILATLFSEAVKGNIALSERIRLTKEDLVPGSGVFQLFDPGVEVSIKDIATLMIIVSDNLATDKVLEFVGKDKVNALTRTLGLKQTHLEHNIWELLSLYVGIEPKEKGADTYEELDRLLEEDIDRSCSSIFDMSIKNNSATPSEMNTLLTCIAQGKVATPTACGQMIEILNNQQFGHRLPYLLPEGVRTANKTGTIGGSVNDVGIIYMPDERGAFAISVLTKEIVSKIDAEKNIALLAQAAYEYFMGQ